MMIIQKSDSMKIQKNLYIRHDWGKCQCYHAIDKSLLNGGKYYVYVHISYFSYENEKSFWYWLCYVRCESMINVVDL